MQVDQRPRRQDTFDLRDQIHADDGGGNYAGTSDEEEHSVLEDSDNEDQEEFMDDEDDASSSLSIPNESIDFDLVYSLHSFAATVEGQANVVKGDSLFLMDDSNSYWWLVRVLKTQEVGYIPAENIETPFERLARLNKHRNVDLASATQSELQSDVTLSASRVRNALNAPPNPASPLTQPNAPRNGNTVRNPLNQRRSLAFSAALNVHRYPPAVWNEEEWLIEREERRAASLHEREQEGDYDYDEVTFDDDEDHEEGEWDIGNFEAEDRELAEELVAVGRQAEATLAKEAQQANAPQPKPTLSPEPDDGMRWDNATTAARQKPPVVVTEQREPAPSQQPPLRTSRSAERIASDPAEALETRKVTVTPSIVRDPVTTNTMDMQDAGRDRERKREREEEEEEEARKRNKPTKAPEARSTQSTAAPVSSVSAAKPSSGSANGSGKLRKEREPPVEEDGKKKKGSSVFSIFSRKSSKEKGKNSSIGSESELGGRISEESARRPSNGGSSSADGLTSPTTATAMQQQQQQRNSTDPKRIQQMQQQQTSNSAASQLRQRDQAQQALYQQQYLSRSPSSPPEAQPSYGLQSASAYMGSGTVSAAPSAFHSPPTSARQRPGSLILTPSSTNDGMGVPELSVIRVFAGQNLLTEATFKTVLLNSSTTSEDLIKQAVQRFRLDELDPREYFLTVKQVEGSSAVLRNNERPLVVFEGLVESAPRVKRSSVGSVSSVASNLSMHPAIKKLDMNDFTDDSVVKFYLNRRGGDDAVNELDGADDTLIAETTEGDPDLGADTNRQRFLTVSTQGGSDVQPERFTSPSFRFPLQLVVYPDDLPDDMVFDPLTEAIIFKDTLKERGRPSGASPGVSQSMRRKIFIFPKNVTVAEVIEIGLERFGIEEGVVDGGDEVEDKLSKRRSALRVRYGLSVDNGTGKERELSPSSRVIDAFSRPPTQIPNKRRTVDDVNSGDPTFILRRATSYRSSTTSRNRVSVGLDEIALQKLHRDSASSTTSDVADSMQPRSPAASAGLSRQEIIAAQREAIRATQRATLSASANSVRGMDVLLPGNAMIRSARYDAGDKMRYSYVQPDGESYDISDIVQEEWQDSDDNKDVLEGVLGRNKDRIGEKLDRVLTKIHNSGPRQQPNTMISAAPASLRPESPDSQYSVEDGPARSPGLASRTPIPPLRNARATNGQSPALGGRPGTSTPIAAKPSASPGVPGLAARRQPSVTSVVSDISVLRRTPTPKAPQKQLLLPEDDFGVSRMMAVIQLRASAPRKAPLPIDPVDEMLFGRPLEVSSLHPKVREIYTGAFKYMDETDKLLDDFLLKRVTTL
ncbi:hypothetical protein C8F01DRAFT_1221841 [Mycena amicta]|nr:hypothetical protein C8F01DRAFT_1221841 [Mycena amicta]